MTTENIDFKKILKMKLDENANDSDAKTIGGYLHALLFTVWDEGEGFSGKRPFGNSCWEFDLYAAFVKNGVVEGSFDEDGYLENFSDESKDQCNTLVFKLIDYVFKGKM